MMILGSWLLSHSFSYLSLIDHRLLQLFARKYATTLTVASQMK